MIDAILSRLQRVRGRNGNWTACCPAHDDKGPSLAVKEQDGKILLHCFAGCEVSAIVGALGIDMTDLFPPRDDVYDKPQRKVSFYATDLLRVIGHEVQIVAIGAFDIGRGRPLNDVDRQRLLLACERINAALELAP